MKSLLSEFLSIYPDNASMIIPENIIPILQSDQKFKKKDVKIETDTWIEPIYKEALTPLLTLGIKNLETLLSGSFKLSMDEAIKNNYVDKFFYESRL